MKLGIILPYSEEHIENFINHFEATVEGDYKLVFMKQKSNRPLNKGKLFNIGYSLHKNIFDYFCFHDINLIPISADCNYSYEEKPISLVSFKHCSSVISPPNSGKSSLLQAIGETPIFILIM